jgi:peroxiredoxin
MTIKVGDRIPEATLAVMEDGAPKEVSTAEMFGGKRVALFAVPGAFTPTCSQAHLPGFVANADKLKEKGVDSIVCLSVNDVFVMDAWGQAQNADALVMAADGSAAFTDAAGMVFDLTARGLGVRSQRYSMLVNDGVVEALNLDEPGKFEVSGAEQILEGL